MVLPFQTHYKFYNKYICEKCPSSIQCRDSNSQPLEHESPPITTRPGLPPQEICFTRSLNSFKLFFRSRASLANSCSPSTQTSPARPSSRASSCSCSTPSTRRCRSSFTACPSKHFRKEFCSKIRNCTG